MNDVLQKTRKFRNAEYGYFFHSIGGEEPKSWQKSVNAFQVGKLAKQLAELRAKYAFPYLFEHNSEPNGDSFARALRAGNPDSLVMFNPGVCLKRIYPESPEDCTAGETNSPEYLVRNGPLIDGVQYHILTFAGSDWGHGPLRYTAGELVEITRNITDNGGVVSWDLPYQPQTGISENDYAVLEEFSAKYEESKRMFPKTFVRIEYPTQISEGKAVLEPAEETFRFKVEWNGKIFQCCGKTEIPLSIPEQNCAVLQLSNRLFKRNVSVEKRYVFTISEEDSTFENELGKYKISCKDAFLCISAEVKESEWKMNNEVPWAGTCFELFAGAENSLQHFCATPERVVRVTADAYVFDKPDNKCQWTPPDHGVSRLRYRIALSRFCKNLSGRFHVDIRQTSCRNNRFAYANLFSGQLSKQYPATVKFQR